MVTPSQNPAVGGRVPSGDRLDSWKDIAAYLGRDVRTVIRWQEKGLPVHRIPGGKRQAVFAYRSEIDDWMHGRDGAPALGMAKVDEEDIAEIAPPRAEGGPLGRLDGPRPEGSAALSANSRFATPVAYMFLGMIALAVIATTVHFLRPKSSIQITRLIRLTRDGRLKEGLATDGTNIYFGENTESRVELSWMSIQGGPIGHIATPFADVFIDGVYAEGRELLVEGTDGREEERGLWIVPVDGRPPRRVGQFSCHSAARSPDGKVIAYASGKSIFITLDEGLTSRELKRFDGLPTSLTWADFGKRLRFSLENTASTEFQAWEIELDERFNALAVSRSPFKPNHWGKAVEVSEYEFFLTKDAREQFQMWAIPRNRHWWNHSEVLPVDLPAPLTTLSGLAADPRANRLFAIGVEPTRGELVRFEPSSGRSSPCLPGVAAKYPDVSRDGKWVAYTDMEEGSLWISQFDGSGRKELASSFEDLILPKWSPDGSAIAFAGRKPGSVYRVYVVSRDGGLPREASSGEENQGAPTWSPDGKWLMYADTMCPGRSDCAVHRIELATGKIETIPGSKGLRTARWSPDGRYIAAIRPETHQLLLFDFAKQTWNQLSDLSTGDDVSWSHDSRYVYWNSPVGEKPAILRVSATGGIPETVVDMKQFGRLTGVYDAGLCITPDDSVILLRRVSSSEIYAADWSVR